MSMLAMLLFNANKAQDTKALSPADFMWKVAPTPAQLRREKERKARQMWAGIKTWAKTNQAIAESQNHDHPS